MRSRQQSVVDQGCRGNREDSPGLCVTRGAVCMADDLEISTGIERISHCQETGRPWVYQLDPSPLDDDA